MLFLTPIHLGFPDPVPVPLTINRDSTSVSTTARVDVIPENDTPSSDTFEHLAAATLHVCCVAGW